MFFFFFDPPFQKGQVCEIVRNDPRHYTMPKLFPDRIGKRVIISNVMKDHVWCSLDEPVKYRINSKGREVVAYDPRCVSSPYDFDDLKVIEQPKNWAAWLKS